MMASKVLICLLCSEADTVLSMTYQQYTWIQAIRLINQQTKRAKQLTSLMYNIILKKCNDAIEKSV